MKTICLDFDGVIHSYKSGWQGACNISDPPVPGAIPFLREAVKHFKVCIFSSRSHQPGGIRAMGEWLGYHVLDQRLNDQEDLAWASAIEFSTHKPSAFWSLDDRAATFTGKWPTIEEITAFKPWYQQKQ